MRAALLVAARSKDAMSDVDIAHTGSVFFTKERGCWCPRNESDSAHDPGVPDRRQRWRFLFAAWRLRNHPRARQQKIVATKELLSFDGEILFNVIGRDEKSDTPAAVRPSIVVAPARQDRQTPIPPYIKHCPLNEQERREYQTTFASPKDHCGTTASLHFSGQLLQIRRRADRSHASRCMWVSARSPRSPMRRSSAELPSQKVITSLRQLRHFESGQNRRPARSSRLARLLCARSNQRRTRTVSATLTGSTDLFIRDGYSFKFIDGIITQLPRAQIQFAHACSIHRP